MKMIVYLSLSIAAMATNAQSAPVWNLGRLQVTPQVYDSPPGVQTSGGVKALCFDGLPWRGKPTRVFAFYGEPPGASPTAKVPGVVLVHGAGGTASADWVKIWMNRGYAAISIDTEGHLPSEQPPWPRNPEGGPVRTHVTDLRRTINDQWMYHAVADCMLANSLLRSSPAVDPDRIGISGISWGAVVVCDVAGVDQRFRFAVPVYGCGFISESSDIDGSWFVGASSKGTSDPRYPVEQVRAWRSLWDPANFLPQAHLPMLWVAGATDFAFTPSARQRSYTAAPAPHSLTLFSQLNHSETAGRLPEEIFAFADSVVRGHKPLARVIGQGNAGGAAWVRYQSESPLKRAELNFTRDMGRWQDRKWETLPATISGDRASVAVPANATAYYFNLIDNRDLTVSSEHVVSIDAWMP